MSVDANIESRFAKQSRSVADTLPESQAQTNPRERLHSQPPCAASPISAAAGTMPLFAPGPPHPHLRIARPIAIAMDPPSSSFLVNACTFLVLTAPMPSYASSSCTLAVDSA